MSDNCISEIGFNTLPQSVKDWIHDIGWKREDIISYHAKFGDLIEVTITGIKGKRFALFTKLDNGDWKKVLE